MASVLAIVRAEGSRVTPGSLAILGEARRIASSLGAALYAIADVAVPAAECAELIADLGRGGADRVLLCQHDRPQPALWVTRGPALAQAASSIAPRLILIEADASGRDIAPRLALRLGAAYIADPQIDIQGDEVILTQRLYGGTHQLRRDGSRSERPLVLALRPALRRLARGRDDAEVASITAGDPVDHIELMSSQPDPDADLERARVVVSIGGGCSLADVELLRDLADTLGAATAGTRTACERELVGPGRVIDVTGRSVAPSLYIACAASGSLGHLAALAPDTRIVSINRDTRAPIARVAHYGLLGEVADCVPGLIRELRQRNDRMAESA